MKQKILSKKIWIPVLILVLVIHAVLIVALISWGRYIHEGMYGSLNGLITYDHNHSAYRPITVEPKEKKVYIPEMRIHLPYNEVTRDLVYEYQGGSDGHESLEVSTRLAISPFREHLSEKCHQLAYLRVVDEEDKIRHDFDLFKEIELADDRKLAIFANKEDECIDERLSSPHGPEVAAELAKAKSY